MSIGGPPDRMVDVLIAIAAAAGRSIMEVYGSDFAVSIKDDESPVTAADERAEAVILAGLAEADPDAVVISEEAAAAGSVPEPGRRFYLVDPLDGTREFIKRNGEFTVNIALVEEGMPVAGVVHAPAIGRLFVAARDLGAFEVDEPADGAWEKAPRRPIAVRPKPEDGLIVVASRSHSDPATEAYLETVPVSERRSAGSSLKFCLLAAGEADLYPRTGRTMEWDTAAGHAILACAGGSVVTFDGDPLAYGKSGEGLANPGFIARAWR